MRCRDGAWTLGDNPNGDFLKSVCRWGLNVLQRKNLIRRGLNSTASCCADKLELRSLKQFQSCQSCLPTLGPSFPGFPMGPLIPGSPCAQHSVHLRPRDKRSEKKRRWLATREEQLFFTTFYTAPPLIAAISFLAPFLPAGRLALVLRWAPSLPSVLAGLGLWSGTRCRHSAKRGWGRRRRGKRMRKKRKDFIRLKRSTAFLPFIMSHPPGGGQDPDRHRVFSKCLRAGPPPQQRLQECLSHRWAVNFVKLIDCDI